MINGYNITQAGWWPSELLVQEIFTNHFHWTPRTLWITDAPTEYVQRFIEHCDNDEDINFIIYEKYEPTSVTVHFTRS